MIRATSAMTAALRSRRILVVEDEYMIARDVVEALSDVGAETLGPVARVADAMRVIAAEHRIDGALLDVNLFNEPVWPVVDALLARGIPLMLATGYDASAIPLAYATLARLEKPAAGRDLARALAAVLAAAPAHHE